MNVSCKNIAEFVQNYDNLKNENLLHNPVASDCEHKLDADFDRVFTDQYAEYGVMKKWLKYKQVYKFSNPLLKALQDTEVKKFSMDYLTYLAYPVIYLDLSSYSDSHGCFVFFNDNSILKNTTTRTITMIFVDKHLRELNGIYYLEVPSKDSIALDEVFDLTVQKFMLEETRSLITLVINCLMYLSMRVGDIDAAAPVKSNHFFNNEKGKRIKSTIEAKVWNVGYRQTNYYKHEVYSKCIDTPTSHEANMRPHVRCGHWHKHEIVKYDGQTLVLRWHQPTFVNYSCADELPAVEHIVV